VARVIPRRFGAHHICFSFEIANSAQAALVREWHQAWLQNNRPAPRHERAA
jgi:hypothetical protein